MPPFCLLVDAHSWGASHGRQGLPVKTQDCVFFLVVRERSQQRSRQALLKHTHTRTCQILRPYTEFFFLFFLSAKQPQGKRNRRTITIGQSDLVESVPLVHGVGEASRTVSVGGAEVLTLRHLHLDLQTPAYAYEFLCFFFLFLVCRGLRSWMDGWLISIRYIPVFSSNFIQHCDQLWVSTLSNWKMLKPLKKLVLGFQLLPFEKENSQKSTRVVVDNFFFLFATL